MKHGHEPNFGNGWHSMRSQFFSVASDNLKSEIAECLFTIVRLEALDAEFGGEAITYRSPAYSSPAWQEAFWACLARAEEILQTIAMDVETI